MWNVCSEECESSLGVEGIGGQVQIARGMFVVRTLVLSEWALKRSLQTGLKGNQPT